MAGNRPTHILRLSGAENSKRNGWDTVGAMWTNEDGTITLTINRGVVLDWRAIHNDGCRLIAIENSKKENVS